LAILSLDLELEVHLNADDKVTVRTWDNAPALAVAQAEDQVAVEIRHAAALDRRCQPGSCDPGSGRAATTTIEGRFRENADGREFVGGILADHLCTALGCNKTGLFARLIMAEWERLPLNRLKVLVYSGGPEWLFVSPGHSKSGSGNRVWVRFPPSAPSFPARNQAVAESQYPLKLICH